MQTIYAPITSQGKAGVYVIRISGDKTTHCLRALGFTKELQHQRVYFHKIKRPNLDEIIDETLISFFKGPNSLTGEDVCEISIHASKFILKEVFKILSEIEDVRIAQAGEFLKRAFFNQKIDLVQAEAIPDLIASETEIQHKQALNQLQGSLGKIYEDWREKLIEISAKIEAFIDFPDDDLPQDIIDEIELEVEKLKDQIQNHLDDQKIGQKIKEGLNLAIIGAPNSGKSSLINFLAKSEIAIVSEIAGTTRDVVETHLDIAGIAVKISDTAGIRESENQIEQEGIKRALKKAKEADIKIYMVDATNPVIKDDLIDENTIVVYNKIDLTDKENGVSLKNNINTDQLIKEIEEKVSKMIPKDFSPLITQERYRISLNNSIENLESFSLDKNIELAAEDLRMTSREIGKITGKIDIENILDAIFSRFCIGK